MPILQKANLYCEDDKNGFRFIWASEPRLHISDIMILALTAFNFFILYGFFKFMTVSPLLFCVVAERRADKEICTLVELYSHSNREDHVLHY